MVNTMRRIHFIGIAGIGMSGIAELLLHSGYTISGSDLRTSPITERLKSMGARIELGHNAAHLGDAQVVVVSSAIHQNNPELLEAMARQLPIVHRSEMLAELMRLKYSVLVTGTHGKTTTTSMLIAALQATGLDPSASVGGRLNSVGSNACAGHGDIFVAEADESDGSFLHFTPTVAVVTNVDKDHLDHYSGLDEIVRAFKDFLDKIPFYGAACVCSDDPGVQLLMPTIRRKVVTFGLRPDAHITAREIQASGFCTSFIPVVYGKELPRVTLRMPGRHNVSNALASFAVGSFLEQDLEKVVEALNAFTGVQHRTTILGTWKNCTVIDDYAHNPKKISAALRGLREAFPEHHLCAIFQPHRYSRLKHMGDDFARSFSDANSVIVTPIYSAGEAPEPGITPDTVAAAIRTHSFHNTVATIKVASDLNDAASLAAELMRSEPERPTLCVTLGAGDVANVGHVILERLGKA